MNRANIGLLYIGQLVGYLSNLENVKSLIDCGMEKADIEDLKISLHTVIEQFYTQKDDHETIHR